MSWWWVNHSSEKQTYCLISPTDQYIFLQFHVETNGTARKDGGSLSTDYKGEGRRAPVAFSAILPTNGHGPRMEVSEDEPLAQRIVLLRKFWFH